MKSKKLTPRNTAPVKRENMTTAPADAANPSAVNPSPLPMLFLPW